MKGQKYWNVVTACAIACLALGCVLGKSGTGGANKVFLIFGILGVIAGIAGSSYEGKRHPYVCPFCGAVVKPVGRWLPFVGYNGTNTVACTGCGAEIPLQNLKQK